MTTKTLFITATGSGTFTAPSDWPANNVAQQVICIGGGGAGQESTNEPGVSTGSAVNAGAWDGTSSQIGCNFTI
jgi:hypothetical protein